MDHADIAAKRGPGKNTPLISPLALKAVKRIGARSDVKRAFESAPAGHRLAMRRELNPPVLPDFKAWMQAEPTRCCPPASSRPRAGPA